MVTKILLMMFLWTKKVGLNFGNHPPLDHEGPKTGNVQLHRTVCLPLSMDTPTPVADDITV